MAQEDPFAFASPLNKTESMSLYMDGRFGNRLPSWGSLAEWKIAHDDGTYTREICLRYRGEVGGKWCEYNVHPERVEERVSNWVSQGADPSRIYVNASPVAGLDDTLALQGEVMRTPVGLYLLYSTVKKPMRKALAEKREHALGLKAEMVLQHYLWPNDLDELKGLLDSHPDAAIEFSAWGSLGDDLIDIPHHSMVVWEIRKGW